MNLESYENILVTGGSGFIGKNLVSTLKNAGLNVYNPDSRALNLCDYRSTLNYLKSLNPSHIIHLACTSSHPKNSNNKNLVTQDMDMIHNLITSANEGTKVIVSGSVSEYGISGTLSEESICSPDTYYGIAKFNSNLVASMLCKNKGLDLLILRLFGVYGPGEAPHRLFPSLLESIRNLQDFHMSDGKQIRDFIHVQDISLAILKILNLKNFPTGFMNLGTGIGLRVIDVCNKILIETNTASHIQLISSKSRNLTDKDVLISQNKIIEEVLGYKIPQRLNGQEILKLFDLNYCNNFTTNAT
jgi:GDP-4-dehydro-6-deoxy-D-mannose reductase